MLAISRGEKKEFGFSKQIISKDLIKRCRKGDTLAMEAIYQNYKIPIFNLAYRFSSDRSIAEDLLQEIFVKCFVHLEKLRQAKAFNNWLYRIAINTCISYLRQRKKQRQKLVSLSSLEGKITEAANNAHNEMIKHQLDEAIRSLPDKLKSVFLLHDVQGFKHKEIAQILGCTVGTSKSQLFKARMKIRQQLEKR